ncbi:hypothetical protein GUJ93_ZPchr0010g11273 [Zizania palustris]|uniref:HhH-GPD domain-containing protein n=3 Tax=Zizania palustris TaxID=103762 RepID=A0A8J5W9V4_ZIZPA|nr:hypothetical protein GUJ93_ZPchr0010g11273 [Zizania palustris]KAG8085756.1 hypothetical protein GUJ93_ZPchr0010g11273 [Zizania palustris]KAG8085757.1 hypothetical protein GUJ93_ZPchr0010g11273 [Zizania palustris]
MSAMAMLNAIHEGTCPQPAPAGSMRNHDEHVSSSIRPSYNLPVLPAGCTQVPISILLFHRRLTGRGSRPQLSPSPSFMPVPALPNVFEDGAPVQLAGSNFLSLGSASDVFAGDIATNPSELATPNGYNADYAPKQNGLYTEASKTGNEREDSQLPQSAAAVICDNSSKLESVIPANNEETRGQNHQESICQVADGPTDDNIQEYNQIRKRPRTQINQSDSTTLPTLVCKERTLTQLDMQISGAEKIETFKSEDTPAQKLKTRRKKHRPKVIRENKPAKMQKTAVTTPKEKPQDQKPKRKYVRKKRNLGCLEKCAEPVSDELISREPRTAVGSSMTSVRRRLQFEFGEQRVQEDQSSMANSWYKNQEKCVDAQSSVCSVTKSSVQIEHGLQVHMENSPKGLFSDKLFDEYTHLPEATQKPAQEVPLVTPGHFSGELARKQDDVGHNHDPDSTSCIIEKRGLTTMEGNKEDLDLNCSNTNGFQMFCSASSLPEINSTKNQMTKVSKMDKNHTQHYGGESSLSGTRNSIIMRTAAEMLAVYQDGRIKKKRSTRVRRTKFLSVMDVEKNTSQESTQLPRSCMEALYESSYIKFMTKKRSQKALFNSPNSIQPNIELKNRFSSETIFSGGFNGPHRSEETFPRTLPQTPNDKRINLNIHCKVSEGSSASASTLPYMDYLEGVASKLEYLDLNTEQVRRTEMHFSQTMSSFASLGTMNGLTNALVPYDSGVMVPYQTPLHLVKKKRPRAKVDLDFETTKVWNLLMGKAADPVDGTDVEKERWWKQEREVFQGRANSFIARMRLVQGDRHFSPWKGSVVDSVVGVFLTQNVADHLSSSAYMALAASFPPGSVNSNCNDDIVSQDNEEIINTSAVGDKTMFNLFYNGSVPDVGVNCEELSMAYEKNHMEPKDNTTVNELTKGESYSLHYKNPTGGFYDHQTGIDHKSKPISDFSSVELMAHMKSLHETQFQKEISLSQSVVTTKSILQPGLPSSSGMDRAPINFDCRISDAASRQMGSNFDDGKSLAGNDVTANETEYQGIKTAAINNYAVGEPGIPSDSIIYQCFSTIDCQQLDERNDPHVPSTSPNSSIGSASPNFKIGTIEDNFSLLPFDAHLAQRNGNKIVDTTLSSPKTSTELPVKLSCNDKRSSSEASELQEDESLYATGGVIPETASKADYCTLKSGFASYNGLQDTAAQASKPKKSRTTSKKYSDNFDWDKLRRQACNNAHMKERVFDRRDSVDWEAVRCADVQRIADAIRERGMNNVLAARIQKFLNRLVSDHGSIDLEWLRDIPPDSAKDYLLSIRGLGLKSVECVRLLTLHHLAFPVDTNVGRICVRLGWVPIQPLPESLQLHLLELYPILETIQKYLWPRLCKLDQQTLYELHYQMITFGKVFCTKNKPNCNACPMRSECKHFASAFASARLALPSPQDKRLVKLSNQFAFQNGTMPTPNSTPLPQLEGHIPTSDLCANNAEPIIEEPASPREEECPETLENDIEDFDEDSGEIPTIKLNMEAFAQNLENCIKENNKDLQFDDIAKALVAISTEAASIPVPKLKNVHRLRTEHYVYELPDSHPLMQQLALDQREPDDPSPYLLAIRTPDEIKETSEAPKQCCNSQMESGLCSNQMCQNCVSEREIQSRYVRGTILVKQPALPNNHQHY